MRSDFETFLRETSESKIPDEYGDLLGEMFSPADEPATNAEIEDAEHRLGVTLPESFRCFLRVLGPGDWANAGFVSSAEDVDAFLNCWEMTGFVALVDNVREIGDHLAFNPADPEAGGEHPVYYCAHDPFGYARVADSFEDWARATAEAARSATDFYEPFDDEVWTKWKEFEASRPKTKPWWKFW